MDTLFKTSIKINLAGIKYNEYDDLQNCKNHKNQHIIQEYKKAKWVSFTLPPFRQVDSMPIT